LPGGLTKKLEIKRGVKSPQLERKGGPKEKFCAYKGPFPPYWGKKLGKKRKEVPWLENGNFLGKKWFGNPKKK